MKRAILLTGFNNWGKTTHIYSLFARKVFYKNAIYSIQNVNASFIVESHSNDDLGEFRFIDLIKERITTVPNGNNQNIFCAFCPAREPTNDSARILANPPFSQFDEIHLLILKYKWDWHAELRIADLRGYLAGIRNVSLTVIDADQTQTTDQNRKLAREGQIMRYLQVLFP